MFITELVGVVEPENWGRLVSAFDTTEIPPQMLESMLVQDPQNPKLWKVVSRWDSKESLAAYRDSVDTPAGVLMFRLARTEPDVAMYEVKINVGQDGSKWVTDAMPDMP